MRRSNFSCCTCDNYSLSQAIQSPVAHSHVLLSVLPFPAEPRPCRKDVRGSVRDPRILQRHRPTVTAYPNKSIGRAFICTQEFAKLKESLTHVISEKTATMHPGSAAAMPEELAGSFGVGTPRTGHRDMQAQNSRPSLHCNLQSTLLGTPLRTAQVQQSEGQHLELELYSAATKEQAA